MNIKSSMVQKIVIKDIPSLDPVSVYLEDFGVGQGNLIITCSNQSWSYYWGCMGKYNLIEFITTCNNQYLSGKLNPNVSSDICDENSLDDYAKKHIIKLRRDDCISKNEAREMYDQCTNLAEYKDTDSAQYSEIMYNIFGCEWYECFPQKPNPEYVYFCRILDVVKEALIKLKQ